MKEEERQQAILLRLARMRTAPDAPEAFFASGFRALDESLGRRYPRAHMMELFGPAGCGKTTLAIQCVAHAQKNALTAAWIDADHTFDAAYATGLGVDMERVPFAQPATAEQGMEIARQLAGSGAVDLIVVDSAAALVPRLELETGIGCDAPGLHSRVLASSLRKLRQTLGKSCACVVFLNQMRNRPGAFGGTDGGIYKSTDGGSNWRKLIAGLPPITEANLAIAASNPKVIYATVAAGAPPAAAGAATPAAGGRGGGRGGRGGGGGGISFYKTTDGGENWFLASDDPRIAETGSQRHPPENRPQIGRAAW